jgi:integrase
MAIIKRNDRYGVRITDPASGRQIWLGTFDRKHDAIRREREASRDLDLGQFITPKRTRFADFTEKWLDTLSVRDSTLADYRNTCRHLTAHFGPRDIATIRTEEIDQFLSRFAKGHSAATVRKTATRLRQIFKRAVAWGYLAKSPATDLCNVPKPPAPRDWHPLNSGQVADLLDAAPDYWRPLFLTAVMTGLRRGELFGLRWCDILWTERKLRVCYQLQDGRLTEPKSDSSKRTLDLGPQLTAALSAHKQDCPPSNLDLVFPTPRGLPVHTSDFNRDVFRPTAARALLPDLKLHDLRHTFASALIEEGQSIKYVQTVMGHSSATTTLDVYGHLFETGGQDAARRLEACLLARTDERIRQAG